VKHVASLVSSNSARSLLHAARHHGLCG
jgi:hypothetical protein